jgi:hypothetical protein
MNLSLLMHVHQPIRDLHHDIPNIGHGDPVLGARRAIRNVLGKVPITELHIDIVQRGTIYFTMSIYFDNVSMCSRGTQFHHCAHLILKALFNFPPRVRVADRPKGFPCE